MNIDPVILVIVVLLVLVGADMWPSRPRRPRKMTMSR
jgi:hypothetical protein